jgi:cytochrome P450
MSELRAQLMTLLLAGFDTSASLITWTLFVIARSEELQELLMGEIAACDDTSYGPGGIKTPHLDAVIKESARLYPPVWGFGREAITDTTIGEYTVIKGTQIIVSPYRIHRDPRFFPQPETFDHSRWLDPGAALAPCAYIPFGAGPRVCIGRHLAVFKIKIILSRILRHYRLNLVPGFPVEPTPTITLQPRLGLRLQIRPR